MRDRGWMALMEKALIDVAFFLASEKERSVRVKRARSLARWLVGWPAVCCDDSDETKPPSCPGKQKNNARLLLIHRLPSFISFSSGLVVYLSPITKPAPLPACPSISCSGPPVIINENRVYRPSSK